MNNNERQYNSSNANVRYKDDFNAYNSQNMGNRNSYAFDDSDLQLREKHNASKTAGFQKLIEEQNYSTKNSTAENRDLMPSPTTMQFVGKERSYVYEDLNNRQRHVEDEEDASYRINTKSKVMIAVYALVVLTIFTLIILNTRLLKTMDNNINEQEAKIQALMEENTQLYNQYEFVSSDEEVVRRATEMGMIEG